MTWLDTLAVVSLSIALLCALWLAIDVSRRPQQMWIMNPVWPITALYFGPLAVWFYYVYGRTPGPGEPPRREKPFAASAAVAGMHCGAGCTLGDIIAESVLFLTGTVIAGSRLLTSYIGDYTLAYIFGIAFQYYSIAPMRGIYGWPGIWAAMKVDTLSLTAFEIGLFAWMWVMTILPGGMMTPAQPAFWFEMQIGMVLGFVTAYPMNWWLIKIGWKEGM
jgi:hypothetical protein